ncbi:hypothetical protein FE257_001534 [Aspergillus nanangensis]|uniref:Uncharacterized protein n=1 Tax=Aspergillus nanangensis TaxID=2582783 RepID=A0AAD4CTH7_ASPNN|nr:hypothetical protein FE257_001534 [Aspergillus nanangensis]
MALLRRTIPNQFGLYYSSDRGNNTDYLGGDQDGDTPNFQLLKDDLRTTEPYITVWLVCEFLTLLALILFFIGTFIIRQPKDKSNALPFKTIFGSLFGFIISRILSIALLFLYVFDSNVTRSYVALNMVEMIFNLLAVVLLYSILYRTIHRHLERYTEGEPFARVILAHWTILGVLSALAVTNCATRIASLALTVQESSSATLLAQHDSRLTVARAVIFMVISLEILGWGIFIFVRPIAPQTRNKTGEIALIASGLFFFVLLLTDTANSIQYTLLRATPPAYVYAITTFVEFIFITGVYMGIIICSIQWQKDVANAAVPTQPQQKRQSSTPPSPAGTNPQWNRQSTYQPYRPSMAEVLDKNPPVQQYQQDYSPQEPSPATRFYTSSGRSRFGQRQSRPISGGKF